MTRRVKWSAGDNKFLGERKISVMQALETAVLLMEQAGCGEEDIMKYVHMIHMGWIRDGALAPEYLELCGQVLREQQAEAEMEQRLQALRDSAISSIVTDVSAK